MQYALTMRRLRFENEALFFRRKAYGEDGVLIVKGTFPNRASQVGIRKIGSLQRS